MAEFLAPGHQFHKIKAHKDPLSIQDPLSRYWVLGNQLAILLWRLCPSHGRQKRRRNKKRIQILAPSTFARTKHGRRQKEEPTSKRRRIVCGALDARYDDSPEVRALPPSLLTEWRANREALEGQNQLKVPNRLQNGLSSIQRTGLWFFCRHAERFAAQRRWVAGPRRRRCLATQQKPLFKPRRRITTGRLRIRPWSNAPSSGCIGRALWDPIPMSGWWVSGSRGSTAPHMVPTFHLCARDFKFSNRCARQSLWL